MSAKTSALWYFCLSSQRCYSSSFSFFFRVKISRRYSSADFYVLFLFLFIVIVLILKYSKSLKFVDNFLHQHFYPLPCFATNFSVYSLSLASSIRQICIHFFVVYFVADYVNWTCSVVIFDLSQPIVHTVHWCFVGKIYKNHDEMWLFVDLVSYL